ncbi:MAG: hypothetical protein ACLFP4_13030 [Spirochaetales bacterium]
MTLHYDDPSPRLLAQVATEHGTTGITASASEPQIADASLLNAEISMTGDTLTVTVANSNQAAWRGLLGVYVDLPCYADSPFYLLPGFLYGTNRAEQPVHEKAKHWPRIIPGGDSSPTPPYSSFFTVRADRLTHPLSMVRLGGIAVGLSGAVYVDPPGEAMPERSRRGIATATDEANGVQPLVAGFGCAWLQDRARLIYTVGHENAPWLYSGSGVKSQTGPGDDLVLEPQAAITFQCRVFERAAGDSGDNRVFSDLIRALYASTHERPRQVGVDPPSPSANRSAEQMAVAVELIAGALFDHAYNSEAKNYCTSLREQDGAVVQATDSFSISWTGGLAVAVPLLLAAHRMRTDTSQRSRKRDWSAVRAQALECVVHFTRSINPASGLPFDAFRDGRWTTNGWWEEYVWSLEGKRGHSSYLVGEALYYLLLAYEIEKTHGAPHPEWLLFAKKVLAAAEPTISESGEYPYIWSVESGRGMEYDALCGAWMTAARAYEYALAGGQNVLASARRTLSAYHVHVREMLCYGAPHDTWKAPDQEGVLAFIKAARLLHKATGDSYYLECLRDGLDYELTWQYCYNTRPERPPLSTVGWSSAGGSVTSVANQCVHPMGLIVLDDLAWYAEQTGERYYVDRAHDKLLWALQTFNRFDREYDHGLAGWLSERFDATPILSIDNYPDGTPASTWFVAHPWAAGCVLEALTGKLWRKEI